MSFLKNLFSSKDSKMTALELEVAQVNALPIAQEQKDSLIVQLIRASQKAQEVAPAPAVEESVVDYATRLKVPAEYVHVFTSKAQVDKYVADLALARAGGDDFTREITGQKPLTETQKAQLPLLAEIGPDITEALVNKPDDSRADKGTPSRKARYGGAYSGVYDGIAVKRVPDIAQRQVDVWNTKDNLPGENLQASIDFVRWNSWDVRGNYIPDGIYQTGAGLNKSDAGYRSPKDGPYTGPTQQ